jgi:hypothetical protein
LHLTVQSKASNPELHACLYQEYPQDMLPWLFPSLSRTRITMGESDNTLASKAGTRSCLFTSVLLQYIADNLHMTAALLNWIDRKFQSGNANWFWTKNRGVQSIHQSKNNS